jgi:glucan biosynthesis protein C
MKDTSIATQSERSSLKSVRLHYLDWLNVLAILGVFLFHATLPFGDIPYGIQNAQKSLWVTLFGMILSPWGMSLFFMLSGVRSWFALRRRTSRQYISERVKRLAVPFIVFSFLLSPFQGYLAAIHRGTYAGPFLSLAWFRAYVNLLAEPGLSGLLSPSVFYRIGVHLWFLGYLFVYSLIALPLFLWLKTDAGKRLVNRIAERCERQGRILLFIVPLVVIRLLLQPLFPLYTDWADFFFMLVFFVSGYVLYADQRFTRAIRRDWRLALTIGIISALFFVVTSEYAFPADVVDEMNSHARLLFYFSWGAYAVSSWCMVIFMWYVGMRFLDFRDRWLVFGQQALMPFYLLHQPVVFVFAFFVVQWDAAILLKLPVVVLSAFVVTLALAELVRRIQPLRGLFGMKRSK